MRARYRAGAVAFDERDHGPVGHDPTAVREVDAVPHRGSSLHGPAGVAPAEQTRVDLQLMRRAAALSAYVLAAACWLAGGPPVATLDALLACRHHQAHHAHADTRARRRVVRASASEMTDTSDAAVSVAVPAPLATPLDIAVERCVADSPSPSAPPSPSFAPANLPRRTPLA